MFLKETPKGVMIRVRVTPNANAFSVAGEDAWTGEIKIKVKGAASEGKANQELVRELSNALETKVEIVQGHKSHSKVLLIHAAPEAVRRLMR